MCRCESPLPGAVGTELSMWDHLTWGKSAPAYLGNERWFEQRYPELLEHARRVFVEAVNDWLDLNWGEKQYDRTSPRITVIGRNFYGNKKNQKEIDSKTFHAPKTFLLDNHFEACGDLPQSFQEADAVLGRFAIDIVTPVKINYLQKKVGAETVDAFDWNTEMYVFDKMGVDEKDKIVNMFTKDFLLKNVPSRNVKRATWQIGGSGLKKDY
jgi:hypothetical protein